MPTNVYLVQYPDGTGREIHADLVYYTEQIVSLVVTPTSGGSGESVFVASLQSGVTVAKVS